MVTSLAASLFVYTNVLLWVDTICRHLFKNKHYIFDIYTKLSNPVSSD